MPGISVPTASLRAYLVEDNLHVRESLVAALEELTPLKIVDTSGDERVAVDWLAEHGEPCDLIIVDLFLRSGSGLGVLETVRRHYPHLHAIVLSNYATPEIRARCAAAGAERVFDKSRDIDLLVSYCTNLASACDAHPGAQAPPH